MKTIWEREDYVILDYCIWSQASSNGVLLKNDCNKILQFPCKHFKWCNKRQLVIGMSWSMMIWFWEVEKQLKLSRNWWHLCLNILKKERQEFLGCMKLKTMNHLKLSLHYSVWHLTSTEHTEDFILKQWSDDFECSQGLEKLYEENKIMSFWIDVYGLKQAAMAYCSKMSELRHCSIHRSTCKNFNIGNG